MIMYTLNQVNIFLRATAIQSDTVILARLNVAV